MTGIPKAELHVHLEGTATPALVRRLAARNHVALPEDLFSDDDTFNWHDFSHFLTVYDTASSVIVTPADYRDVTYDYLARSAAEGVVYCEMFSSPDHAAATGMTYGEHVAGIAQGIDDARAEYAIEGFIVPTCVRHFGPERAVEVARQVVDEPHPLVVGFGMGGDEASHTPAAFAPAFRLADEAGLPTTVHAGEFGGPESVRAALEHLPVSRLGHGVRAIEDRALVDELAARGVVLECCPTSNIATKVYADYAQHPFPRLLAAGCRVTLNADDPPYFHTSVGREYALAAEHFGLDDAALGAITATAIEAGFAPAATRAAILERAGL